MSTPVFAPLDAAGLNLQAVFDCRALPAAVREHLDALVPGTSFRQLILIGNGGGAFWQALLAAGRHSADPMDDFSRDTVEAWCRDTLGDPRRHLLYPGEAPIGLQSLGELAGWHHPSPFMVGIQAHWGSWFAYRAALLADSMLPTTPRLSTASPCARCVSRPCVTACPAHALDEGFRLKRCLDERLREDSPCAATCLARLACPVGQAQRYPDAQIRHSYGRSLDMLRRYRDTLDDELNADARPS